MLTAMLSMSKRVASVAADGSVSNFRTLAPLLAQLSEMVKQKVGRRVDLDCELVVLQVPLGRKGAASRQEWPVVAPTQMRYGPMDPVLVVRNMGCLFG